MDAEIISKPSNYDLYRSVSSAASYNVSKLQILSAVLTLNDIQEEATSEAIAVLIGRPVEAVCHLAGRYEKKGLLSRRLLKRKNRLVRGRLYRYSITKKGIE